MSTKSIADYIKPTIITGQQYGTKVSVEINHSDTDIDELFEAFQTIIVGLGYHHSTWKQWIVDKADEYKEEEIENSKDMGMYEPSPELRRAAEEYVKMLSEKDIDEALAEHNEIEWTDEMEKQYWKNEGNEHMPPELEQQFWNEQPPEPFATPEEVEKYNIDGEFDDYGKRIVKESKKIGRRGIKKK